MIQAGNSTLRRSNDWGQIIQAGNSTLRRSNDWGQINGTRTLLMNEGTLGARSSTMRITEPSLRSRHYGRLTLSAAITQRPRMVLGQPEFRTLSAYAYKKAISLVPVSSPAVVRVVFCFVRAFGWHRCRRLQPLSSGRSGDNQLRATSENPGSAAKGTRSSSLSSGRRAALPCACGSIK